jgi:uncharacterized protein YukE
LKAQSTEAVAFGSGGGDGEGGQGIEGALSQLETSQAEGEALIGSLVEAEQLVHQMEDAHNEELEELIAIQTLVKAEQKRQQQGQTEMGESAARLEVIKTSHADAVLDLQEAQKRAESMLHNHSEQIGRLQGLGEGLGHSATQAEMQKLRDKMGEVQEKLEALHAEADQLHALMESIRGDEQGMRERHQAEMDQQQVEMDMLSRDQEN